MLVEKRRIYSCLPPRYYRFYFMHNSECEYVRRIEEPRRGLTLVETRAEFIRISSLGEA